MPQNLYEFLWVFIIYAFIGWCTEVAYAALDTGKFVNRGFLNGPYCPIYGVGVVIVVAVLTPLKESLLALFFGSFLLTTVLEYVTGFLLEKVFHDKWWDYSDMPFNIKGYICLKFSVYWGLACTFVMKIVHPIIYDAILWIPHVLGIVLISIFICVFAVDCFLTVSTILKLNERLKAMDEMAAAIHKLSDEIGGNIYENTTDIVKKSREFQESHPELIDRLSEGKERIAQFPETAKNALAESTEATRERISEQRENILEFPGNTKAKFTEAADTLREKKRRHAELVAEYQKLSNEKNFGFRRLMEAFPDMTSRDNDEVLQKLKMKFKADRPQKKK